MPGLDFSGIPLLVVDDEHMARSLLVRMLKRLGFTSVEEASDGARALEAVHSLKPAAVFCDVHMKPKDGLTFVTELRHTADASVRKTPVIMVTSEERPEAYDVANQLSISGYLIKPTNLTGVRMALERALGMEF